MISWNDNPLLLPMRVVAMAVGKSVPGDGMFQWTDLSPDYGKLKNGFYFGSELVGDPTGLMAAEPPVGIHLHFRLPSPFTRSNDEDGKLTFDPFPNRWLIQRIVITADAAPPTHRAWLVRSDRADEDGIPWVERMPTENEPLEIRRIGRQDELTDLMPTTNEAAERTLTAVGRGDPLFAAYYPACRSVLGFHDSAEDLSAGDGVTYLVSGFFSSDALDPLTREDPVAWMKTHGISWASKDGASTPGRILCHGATAFEWRGEDADYMVETGSGSDDQGGPFKQTETEFEKTHTVALGDTGVEALAALLVNAATTDGAQPDATGLFQNVLSALQESITDQPGSFGTMGIDLHARRFDPLPGGNLFKIERVPEPAVESMAPDGHSPSAALPAALRKALNALNDIQERYDSLERRIMARRRQIHALWCRKMARLDAFSEDPVSPTEYETFIHKVLKTLLEQDLAAYAKAGSDRKAALADTPDGGKEPTIRQLLRRYSKLDSDRNTRLNEGKPLPMYELSQTAAPPFFAAAEPSVAICGPALRRRNDGATAEDLFCRTKEEILCPDRDNGRNREEVVDALLERVFGAPPKTVDALQRALLAEILLLDDSLGLGNPASGGKEPHAAAVTRQHGNPWTPFLIAWSVCWESDISVTGEDRIEKDQISQRWKLGSDGEFQRLNKDDLAAPRRISGYGIAAASVARELDNHLAGLNDSHPLRDTLRSGNIGTLRLAGFHDALRLHRPAPRLPPLDLVRWRKAQSDEPFYLDPIANMLDMGRTRYPTEPDNLTPEFQPIRSGRMRLKKLYVIDCFGQTMKLPLTAIAMGAEKTRRLHSNENCADRNPVQSSLTDTSPAFLFKPRLVQPARLRFELADGGLQGWLLLNHIDQSLALYNAGGRPTAILQYRMIPPEGTTAPGFFATDMAWKGGAPGTENAHVTHFRNWLKSLSVDDSRYFLDLLSEAIASADDRVPEGDDTTGVLVGRPFALVRARLWIELHGLPTARPAVPENQKAPPDSHGLEQVNWPVRLGDSRERSDGLLGLFVCDEDGIPLANNQFFKPWASAPAPHQGVFFEQELSIDCSKPLNVMLIMDPQARVHASTGVLPRDWMLLPADLAGAGGRVREVAFRTGPVLGPKGQPSMPRPSADYGEWNWAFRPDVTARAEMENDAMRQADLVEADIRAGGLDNPSVLSEGWLRLAMDISIRRFQGVRRGDQASFAWSVTGAEMIELIRDPDTAREIRIETLNPLTAETEDFLIDAPGSMVVRLRATSDGTSVSRDVVLR